MFVSAMPLRPQQGHELFFADPTIYVGKYYLTGTRGSRGGPAGFSVLESTDLKHWALPEGAKNKVEGDKFLVKKLINGNEKAFRKLFDSYRNV